MSPLIPDVPEVIEPDVVEQVPVADGVALHARRWHGGDGPGAGRPVVLVHGLASNARLWDGVASGLAALGHPVTAIDQRGHGRSSKPDAGYDMVTVTDDLRALLDQVVPSSPDTARPVVVGQSWGGNVVIELAARFPDLPAAVVCVDGGSIHLAQQFPDWDDCARDLAPPRLVGTPAADLEAMIRRSHPDWPESGIAGTMACFEVRDDGTIAPWLTLERHLLVLRGLWEHVPIDRYAHVTAPVTFLIADPGADEADDPDAVAWRIARERGTSQAEAALSDVHTEWIVGDHDLHAQHPGLVARHLHHATLPR